MISWRPALRSLGTIGIPLLIFIAVSADLPASAQDPNAVVITSVGMGAPPADKESPDSATPAYSAVDDARKKAVLMYLYETLGRDDFFRLQGAMPLRVL